MIVFCFSIPWPNHCAPPSKPNHTPEKKLLDTQAHIPQSSYPVILVFLLRLISWLVVRGDLAAVRDLRDEEEGRQGEAHGTAELPPVSPDGTHPRQATEPLCSGCQEENQKKAQYVFDPML